MLVLERAAVLSEAGAGVQLSPNATRILQGLGLLERLRAVASVPQCLRIRRGRDGATLAVVEMGASAEQRWGSPNLVLSRADLQRLLIEEVAGTPLISLETASTFVRFTASADTVGVVTRQRCGTEVHRETPALIGADGLRSTVRRQMNPYARDAIVYSGRTAWRATVDCRGIDANWRRSETGLWLAPRSHLVHYPVRSGAALNIVAVLQDASGSTMEDPAWNTPGDASSLQRRFGAWTPSVRTLLAAASDWRIWPLFERPALQRWSRGRVTLLGDAAHPVLPFMAQGAAQAIEDAAALRDAFEHFGDDVAAALVNYQSRRMHRANSVQRQSRQQGRIYHMGGLMALARDAIMRRLGPDRLAARYDWVYRASQKERDFRVPGLPRPARPPE